MSNLKIIQHMFVVVRKSICSPWGIIPFCKNWCSVLCYGSKLSFCFLWLQCGHSHIPQNSHCNCKILEWWGSTHWSLPHAVARCFISNAHMKIKSFFRGLIFLKYLWLTKSLDLIVLVGPLEEQDSHSLQLHKTIWYESAPNCGHVTVCISFMEHLNQLYMDCISNHIQYFMLQYAVSQGLVSVSATFARQLYIDLSITKSLEHVAGWSCSVIVHLHNNLQSVVFQTIFLYELFVIDFYFYLLLGTSVFTATSSISR